MLLTAKEVAKILRISPKAVYRMVAKNLIPFFRFGHGRGIIRFDEQQIKKWLERNSR